MIVIPV
jgi:hypothetical protein